jgi:hypothetical protein
MGFFISQGEIMRSLFHFSSISKKYLQERGIRHEISAKEGHREKAFSVLARARFQPVLLCFSNCLEWRHRSQ